MEANYKIYIDEAGVIKAILLPEEPKEPDYGDCEMDASDYPDMTGEELYKKRMRLWSQEMDNHNKALSKAKQEAVPFINQHQLMYECCYTLSYKTGKFEELVPDTIHDIPEGYSVEVENNCHQTGLPCGVPCNGEENCRKFAILKKTSPPLPVNTEDEKGVDQMENNWHNVTDPEWTAVANAFKSYTIEAAVERLKHQGYRVYNPPNTEGKLEGVDQKEILRKKFDKACEDNLERLSDQNLPTEDMWDFVFDFFWSEIEKRDKELVLLKLSFEYKQSLLKLLTVDYDKLREELASLRKAMEAADEVIKIYTEGNPPKGYTKELIASEKYQHLKDKILPKQIKP